jgi:hypothetical protein
LGHQRKSSTIPPNPSSDIVLVSERVSGPRAKTKVAGSLLQYGKVHVVPVRDVPPASGRLTEAVYRAFEILVALFGLTAFLPLMLLLGALIRCDSPGPALFFHKRPARSKSMPGYDLVGRGICARRQRAIARTNYTTYQASSGS